MTISEQKSACRTAVKKILRNIPDRKEKESAVTKRALAFIDENGYKKIAVYLSFGDELSTDNLVKELFARGADVFAPVVAGENMIFTKITEETNFSFGAFGIREGEITVTSTDFDVIFLPLLAFDEKNNRMGRGKGYYDRFLKTASGVKIGLAFKEQRVPFVPTEDTDIPLDGVFSD